MVRTIFTVMGHRVDDVLLKAIIMEVDADGSGELEFSEFVTLAAQFLIEEDAEEMQNELKEAFRLYDKEGCTHFPTLSRTIETNVIIKLSRYLQATATSQLPHCAKFCMSWTTNCPPTIWTAS